MLSLGDGTRPQYLTRENALDIKVDLMILLCKERQVFLRLLSDSASSSDGAKEGITGAGVVRE
jgi:hypothetical protein